MAVTPTTWNPYDIGLDVSLSNNNLTANLPISVNASVRATTAKTTGKWYYECVAEWGAGTRLAGIMTATGLLNDFPGADSQGWGLIFFSGQWQLFNTGSPTAYGGSALPWSVIGICLDLDNNFLYYTQNGANLVGNPAALTGGKAIVAGTWFASVGGSDPPSPRIITSMFGANAFAFSPPSGFTAWDTTPFITNSFSSTDAYIARIPQPVGT